VLRPVSVRAAPAHPRRRPATPAGRDPGVRSSRVVKPVRIAHW